jgi:mRNA interferase HigB
MHIVSRSMLVAFYSRPEHREAKGPLEAWYDVARQTHWASPAEVKAQYRHASVIANNRVVFNSKGNDYRLIVAFAYRTQRGYIKFIGTHAQYDLVDAATVDQSPSKE